MRICCTDGPTEYPAIIWEVYSSKSPTGVRRSIAVSNDGGKWVFAESGERYPFEQSDRYNRRRIQERFTAEMLDEYAAQFGIEIFSDEFLMVNASAPAVRLERTTKIWHSPEFTLRDVVEGKPWRRG